MDVFQLLILYADDMQRVLVKPLLDESIEFAFILKFPIHTFESIVLNRIGQFQGDFNGLHFRWIIVVTIKTNDLRLRILKFCGDENTIVTRHIQQ